MKSIRFQIFLSHIIKRKHFLEERRADRYSEYMLALISWNHLQKELKKEEKKERKKLVRLFSGQALADYQYAGTEEFTY